VQALALRVRTAARTVLPQKSQLVLAFAALVTLTWLVLLFWVSAGIIELI
jgi:hypothetical protein